MAGCGGSLIRCPFSGISIDLSEPETKKCLPLSSIASVCAGHQQSIEKDQLTSIISDQISTRRRKFGVIERPEVIERRSEARDRRSEVQLSVQVDFPPKIGRQKSLDESKSASVLMKQLSVPHRESTDPGDLLKPSQLMNEKPHLASCPGLNSYRSKSFGSSCTLFDQKRPGTTSPTNLLPSKVTERTRAPDEACAMYGMLLLSACQFGQVRLG